MLCRTCNIKFTPPKESKSSQCKYCIAEDELEDNLEDELNFLLNPSGKTVVLEYEESQLGIDR